MQFGRTETMEQQLQSEGGLVVRGILFSRDNPSAVVGTEVVHEGDKVLGATIVRINKDSVEFEKNGERWSQRVESRKIANP